MKDSLSSNSFPNPIATKSEKKDKEYGLSMVKGMWAKEQSQGLSFYSKRDKIIENRLWAEGTQSIDHIKGQIDGGDTSWLTFDLSIASPIPKLVEVFVGNIMNRTFDVVAKSLDKTAKHERDEELRRRKLGIKIRENAKVFQDAGIPIPKIGDDKFSSVREAESDLKLNYKVPVEEALEMTIKSVMEDSNAEYIKTKLARELAINKCAVTRAYTDGSGRSKIRYVDAADFIHSYVKYDDFRDMYYAGEVIEMSLVDAMVRFQDDDLNEKDWVKIGTSYGGKLGNPSLSNYYGDGGYTLEDVQDFKVRFIDFQFKSENTYRYKKKSSKKGSGFIFEEVDENWELPKNTNRKTEVKEKKFSDIYEGVWAIDTDYVLGYRKKPNMVRKNVGGVPSTDAELDFKAYAPNIYEGVNKSLVELMIPHAEAIILYQLKTQQYVSKAAPPGIGVDVTALQGVITGMGDPTVQGNDFTNLTTLYKHTGDVYYSSVREDGTPIQNTQPIVPLENGISRSVQSLIELGNTEMNRIYQVTGFNPTADGSAQTKDTAVGIEKIRANSFNIAVKPLADAHTDILERTFTHIGEIEKDRIISDKEYSEFIIGKLGEDRVDYQKLVGYVKYSDLSIFVKFRPTEEDLLELNQDLMKAVEVGQITIADSIKCKDVAKTSIKEAQRFLQEAIEIKLNNDRKTSEMQQKQNGDLQIQSAKAKESSEIAIINAQGDRDIRVLQEEYRLKMELANADGIEDRKTEVTKGEVKKELIEEMEGQETSSEKPKDTINPSSSPISKPRVEGAGSMVPAPKVGIKPNDDVRKSI